MKNYLQIGVRSLVCSSGSLLTTSFNHTILLHHENFERLKYFFAQFVEDRSSYNRVEGFAQSAVDKGFIAVQLLANHPEIFDLPISAERPMQCEDVLGKFPLYGASISELSTHLQGQCMEIHPCYEFLSPSIIQHRFVVGE